MALVESYRTARGPRQRVVAYLGVEVAKVDDNRLYHGLNKLLPLKEKLEVFLKERLGELFELDDDLLLYDVTSTYFEGSADKVTLAKHGYSRDHRSDCKPVCIGLVVSRCGMPLGYEVFAGNRHDSTTLEEVVETMEGRAGYSTSSCPPVPASKSANAASPNLPAHQQILLQHLGTHLPESLRTIKM